ncbi:MAG: zinc-dependent alcohol dehydrogenase family protein [Sphingomonadales bacterium]|nr:zinc-dependent alcohol dehydrogenase family protein [Sphingomonadales bacterium]MDE2170762.1 zinc-dependent alcohol dehydrogenase family protein [Sphingomonadales bacterium]
MNTLPTMLAAFADIANGPFNLRTVARPNAGAGEVLIRVHASGTNPLDTKIHAGQAAHARRPLPTVLGMDMAGVVEQVGSGVTGFAAGDDVYGLIGGVGALPGTQAQYVAADARLLAHKPSNLTMREAAILPLVTITAWEGLIDRAAIRTGDTVLVQGGAGGVGHVAVQIALAHGARVFATAFAQDHDYLRGLGAIPIDATQDVDLYVAEHTEGRGFDVVYDTGGGAMLDASFRAVRRFGHVVSCLGWGTHALAPLSFKQATYSGVFTLHTLLADEGRAHYGEILTAAAAMAEGGHLLPRLDPRQFTMDQIGDAYDAVAGGNGTHRARGKIAITIA